MSRKEELRAIKVDPPAAWPPPPPPQPIEGPILTKLRKDRYVKMSALRKAERELTEVENQITWLERHPEAETIFAALIASGIGIAVEQKT